MGFFDSIKKNIKSVADFLRTNGGQGYSHKQPAAKPTVKPTLSIPKSVSVPKIADVRAPAGKASFGSLPSFPRIQSLSPEKMTTVRAPAWSKMAEEKEKEKPADSEEYIEAKAGDQALTDWLTSGGKTGYDELVLDGSPESLDNFYDLIQESPKGAWDLFKENPESSSLADVILTPGKIVDKSFSDSVMEKKIRNRLVKEGEANARKRYDDWMEGLMANEDNWINDASDIDRIASDLESAGIYNTGLAGLYADWAPVAAADMAGKELTDEDLVSMSNAYRLSLLGDYMADGSNKGVFGNNLGALSHYLSPIMAGQIGSDYFLPGKTEGVTGIGTAGGKWSGAGQGIDSEQFRRYARSSDLNFSYDDLKDMLEREYNANIYDIIGPSQLAGYGGNLDAIGDEAVRARIEESLRAARDSGRKGKGKK